MSISRFFLSTLFVLSVVFWMAPDAEAVYYGSVLSYSGPLSGFSFTSVSSYDGYSTCLVYDYDYEYCALWEDGNPWGALWGRLYSPSGLYSANSTWSYSWAEVDYYVSSPGGGTWSAQGEHYLGFDVTRQRCYADGTCDPSYWVGTTSTLIAYTNAPVTVPQRLTWISYNPSAFTAPGCVAVNFDGGIARADFKWTLNDGPENIQTAWANGATSCVGPTDTGSFGTYKIIAAKNDADPYVSFLPIVGVLLVISPPPPPIFVVTSNGTQISSGATTYISADPNTGAPIMPSLTANLVSGGTPFTGNVTYSFNVNYTGEDGITQYSDTFSPGSLPFGQSWDISASMGGLFAGGTASVTYNYASYSGGLTFYIRGQNPTAAQIKTFLGASPWFLPLIPGAETGYQQFRSSGLPYFGAPRGFGVMQVDPPPQPYEAVLWNWQSNAQAGANQVNTKQFGSYNFWIHPVGASGPNDPGGQVQQWQTWNTANPNRTVAAPADSTGSCVFGSAGDGSPPAGTHSFADAIWIKQYNGAPSGNYIFWDNVTDANNQTWGYHRTETVIVNGSPVIINYVQRVCSQ
jgi:hypothetical protein